MPYQGPLIRWMVFDVSCHYWWWYARFRRFVTWHPPPYQRPMVSRPAENVDVEWCCRGRVQCSRGCRDWCWECAQDTSVLSSLDSPGARSYCHVAASSAHVSVYNCHIYYSYNIARLYDSHYTESSSFSWYINKETSYASWTERDNWSDGMGSPKLWLGITEVMVSVHRNGG